MISKLKAKATISGDNKAGNKNISGIVSSIIYVCSVTWENNG